MFLTRLINSQTHNDVDMDTAMNHLSLSPNGDHLNQHIPNEDECPCYLDTLNLRRRNLEHPSEISRCLSFYSSMSDLLVELDLSRNGLSDLPLEINQLVNIRQLNLACNRFTKLPPVLYSMSNLQHLDITENQLTHLDNLPMALQHLQTLRASGNRLERLDDRIDLWPHMTFLQLGSECGGNRLVELPESLAGMIRLEELDLSNNQLQNWRLYLPPSLKHLKLSGNQLKGIPQYLLICSPNLETLDLSSNRLAFLPFMIGNKNTTSSSSLQQIDLSNNNIYIVPITVFNACPHVILAGNPALEYHRNSTFRQSQLLRDFSNITVCSSPNIDFCLDLVLIELLDHKSTLPASENNSFWINFTDDTHDSITLETRKEEILATLSRLKHQNTTEETDTLYPEQQQQQQQGKVFTHDGKVWIPSLQELAMRSSKKHQLKLQSSTNKGMMIPRTLLDDLEMENNCSICGGSCVNEWLSAIQVCAYQAYSSVVCKVALCSTACWLLHYQKTRAPAYTIPNSFLGRLMESEVPGTPTVARTPLYPPVFALPNTFLGRLMESTTPIPPAPTLTDLEQQQQQPTSVSQSSPLDPEPNSFEWIVAAAAASAAQLEQGRALE